MESTGYMCGIDFQHELGEAPGPSKIYTTIVEAKKAHTCWRECGIVKVTVTLEEWVVKQDLFRNIKRRSKAKEVGKKDGRKTKVRGVRR